jgi:hypothetical protein
MHRLPSFNPFTAPDAVCSQCGVTMEKEVMRGPMNRPSGILYRCQNEQSGCDYQIESDVRLTGSCFPVTAHAGS